MPFLVQPFYSTGFPVILPVGYGHCIWVGLASVVFMQWQYSKVHEARRKYEVPPEITVSNTAIYYSWMYKSYRSSMEIYPHFLLAITLGGIDFPYLTAMFGWIWLTGRYIYARNYDCGRFLGRQQGSMYQFGQWMCLFFLGKFGFRRFHMPGTDTLL